MNELRTEAPLALVTLRAYRPAPARIEMIYLPAPGRFLRALAALVVLWGLVPVLIWVPPHYPWAFGSFVAGAYLAYRQWTGRYYVRTFAGLCPRCGHALSMGVDRTIDLPHTLTCYHCHFEPMLEVRFPGDAEGKSAAAPMHHSPDCVGLWRLRWLADEPFLVCERCLAHSPASADARAAADAENQRAALLERLSAEGKTLL